MDDRNKTVQRLPGQLVVIAIAALAVALFSVLGLVVAFRFSSVWGILLLPLVIPAALAICAIIAWRFPRKKVSDERIRAKQA